MLQKSVVHSPLGGKLLTQCMLQSIQSKGVMVHPAYTFKRTEITPGQFEVSCSAHLLFSAHSILASEMYDQTHDGMAAWKSSPKYSIGDLVYTIRSPVLDVNLHRVLNLPDDVTSIYTSTCRLLNSSHCCQELFVFSKISSLDCQDIVTIEAYSNLLSPSVVALVRLCLTRCLLMPCKGGHQPYARPKSELHWN